MEFTVKPDITIDVRRCDECGCWWGLEKYCSGKCPLCADRAVDRANKRTDHAERQARGLRGALKRNARRGT